MFSVGPRSMAIFVVGKGGSVVVEQTTWKDSETVDTLYKTSNLRVAIYSELYSGDDY